MGVTVMNKRNLAGLSRRSRLQRCASFTLGVALVVTGAASTPGRVGSAVSAQGLNPCGLLTGDEIQSLAPKTSVPDGVSNSQRLLESVRAATGDAVVSEIGEAAVFKPDSFAYATATAFVKGRVVQVHVDGFYASEKKDQIIGLLKAAASRP